MQRSQSTLERLRDNFEWKDAKGVDQVGVHLAPGTALSGRRALPAPDCALCAQGVNVRNRAGELVRLVFDTRRLEQEREKVRGEALIVWVARPCRPTHHITSMLRFVGLEERRQVQGGVQQ